MIKLSLESIKSKPFNSFNTIILFFITIVVSWVIEMVSRSEDHRFKIAFFDLETTVPTQPSQRYTIWEFGSILVCPENLEVFDPYSTLVRPADPSTIASLPMRIDRDSVASAPTFQEIADRVYNILHGRIWAGHNTVSFDCVRIREAFTYIGRPAPEPIGTIDTLELLQRFGRRAGNMKMATLANYFGLGQQKHRSLDDVRMNLEVLKCCATVLFLESSLPDILTENDPIPSLRTQNAEDNLVESSTARDHLLMGPLSNEMQEELNQPDAAVGFLEPDQVFIPHISAPLVPFYRGSQRIKLLHDLQLCCRHMKIRFGINTGYFDDAGRPKLNIMAEAPPNLCKVLDACDDIASKVSVDSGSNSEWRPVVIRQQGFCDHPTVRLRIPPAVPGDTRIYATEIYQKEPSGTEQRLVFTKFDASELSTLFKQGSFIDAFFSLDPYDYQQSAGIRLVAKILVIHSN